MPWCRLQVLYLYYKANISDDLYPTAVFDVAGYMGSSQTILPDINVTSVHISK